MRLIRAVKIKVKDIKSFDISKFTRVFKYLLYFSLFALFYVIEELPAGFPLIFSVKPMLIISLLVIISLLESEMSTVFFALGAGILLDVSMAPLGVSSIFLCIVCTLLSAFGKKKFHVRIFSAVVSTFLVSLLYSLYIVIAVYVLPGSDKAFLIFVDRYIPSVLYTTLKSPLMCIVILSLYTAFQKRLK